MFFPFLPSNIINFSHTLEIMNALNIENDSIWKFTQTLERRKHHLCLNLQFVKAHWKRETGWTSQSTKRKLSHRNKLFQFPLKAEAFKHLVLAQGKKKHNKNRTATTTKKQPTLLDQNILQYSLATYKMNFHFTRELRDIQKLCLA